MQNIISIILGVILLLCPACQEKSNSEKVIEEVTSQSNALPEWITIDFVMGHFDPSVHKDFVLVDKRYADNASRLLHKDTYEAFKKMHAAALQAGHTLIIKSATRNFEYQKGIWTRKWNGQTSLESGLSAPDIEDPVERAQKILLYSSMPGTSRHHWGTDIDINSFENSYFKKGEGLKLYNWMTKHAADFEFCQPYTDKSNGRAGYEEERWHWSYIPLAKPLTQFCKENLKNEMIKGFEGSEVATEVDMLNNYILGINTNCN